jgi:non-lysosomal glucosylceramidase
MASWAAVPALSGFAWDGRAKAMTFNPVVADAPVVADSAAEGTFFWSNGDAWGTCKIGPGGHSAELRVLHGDLALKSFRLGSAPAKAFKQTKDLKEGQTVRVDF